MIHGARAVPSIVSSSQFRWLGLFFTCLWFGCSEHAPDLSTAQSAQAYLTPDESSEDASSEFDLSLEDEATRVLGGIDQEPEWAVRYGREPWRQPPQARSGDSLQLPARVNIGDIVDRVRHAFDAAPPDGVLAARADSYRASVSRRGLAFSPHHLSSETEGDGLPVPDPATELRLRTTSIRIGDAEVRGVLGAERVVLGNTVQRELGAGIVEHIEAKAAGVELVWFLPTRPSTGDVTITLDAAGLRYAGESAEGHHYADAAGLARVRIGHAELVDALGERTPILGQVLRNGLAYTIPNAVLDGAAFPVALDPLVTAEMGMDNPVETAGQRLSPQVAGSSTHLVVWQDSRNGSWDIYGTTITFEGTAVYPWGIPIATGSATQTQPAVAMIPGGSTFWVVWTDNRAGSYDIYGTRVNTSGVVLHSAGVAISSASGTQQLPSVACSSSNCAAVWRGVSSGIAANYDIYGALLGTNGSVLQTNLPISTHITSESEPAIASNGTGYQVAWSRAGDLFGRRLDANGVPSAEATLAAESGTDSAPAISALSGGTSYLLAWQTTTTTHWACPELVDT